MRRPLAGLDSRRTEPKPGAILTFGQLSVRNLDYLRIDKQLTRRLEATELGT
jgi:hypothetical protein